ncbi:beta-lactamase family protein [Plantactinospora sp. S1510]|uniref:Beta-lactamase family protein n=1 Tax=Plantactinospora alkalitolerans TaxID=2789879 RepID=A0ABS0GQI4_9ACTN|nr:serine hydrolase domain-containing protein [Plantactinospora alkalitolerans]MBF9128464.1 beta-lactamase family protein [Plantactinospora alkalitolerans]
MKISTGRTRFLAALVGVALAGSTVSPALAGTSTSGSGGAGTSTSGGAGRQSVAACTGAGMDPAAMVAAIQGLPSAEATAAQVRVNSGAGCWTGRSGVADLRTGAPVPDGARFRIGSVTKVFTATVVLQLVAEGRVGLDVPVQRYLPRLLPADYPAVTVRQLLDHTSGLPSPTLPDGVEWQLAHRFDRWTPEQIVRAALRNERAFEPGDKQHYTNMGYIVAGMLIERVTGHSYAHEMRERIFEPLGLRDTYVPGADPTIRGPHAHGYQTVSRNGRTTLVDVTNWSQTMTPAAGDMISTLADLDTFLRELFAGRLLPAAQLDEMFTLPETSDGEPALYSIGLTAFPLPTGEVLWGKSGARWGYSTAIAASRDGTLRAVYSVNSTDAKGDTQPAITERIIGAALSMR